MVLACDFDPAVVHVSNWDIAAVVAELEFAGLPAQGQAQDLVTEADPEERLALGQGPHHVSHTLHSAWISRPVGAVSYTHLTLPTKA